MEVISNPFNEIVIDNVAVDTNLDAQVPNIHGVDFSKLELLPQNVDIVIYHGRCSDGFGAALAFYKLFQPTGGLNANGRKVTYFAASFHIPPPPCTGLNVAICDFSYKKDVMLKLISDANSLAIIDHHKSAEEDLTHILEKNKIFRMDHSGAFLTWAYCFPTLPMPLLIQYIQDNDIWLKAMLNTREITSYIFSLPFEFEEYEKLLDENVLLNDILPVAIGMQKQNEIYTNEALSHVLMKFVQLDGMYFFVASTNTSVLKSEIGNRIFTKYENANFSCAYSMSDTTAYLSLRSTNDRTDVSKIASKFGGGGHRCASGMTVFGSCDFGNVLDVNVMYNLLNNIYVGESQLLGETVVYLNCTHNRKQIGKYLLQTRYHDEVLGENVQECCSILRNVTKDNTFFVSCNISCVWNYDGFNNVTWFSISWTDKQNVDNLKDALAKENDFQYIHNDKRILFTRKGCVNRV
jgi:oligoribonuclease NrnB/cAMP/cGMP phosphodiesterase (DHH superfamily)